jgi:hypothetical protein
LIIFFYNSPELLRSQALIDVLLEPTKNAAFTLHFNHYIQGFFHRYVLKKDIMIISTSHLMNNTNLSFQWSNAARPTWIRNFALSMHILSLWLCHILHSTVANIVILIPTQGKHFISRITLLTRYRNHDRWQSGCLPGRLSRNTGEKNIYIVFYLLFKQRALNITITIHFNNRYLVRSHPLHNRQRRWHALCEAYAFHITLYLSLRIINCIAIW